MIYKLTERFDTVDGHAVNERRLVGIVVGNENLTSACLTRGKSHRENTADRPYLTGERKLTYKRAGGEIKVRGNHSVSLEN